MKREVVLHRRLLTPTEVGKILRLSHSSVCRLCRQGVIPAVQIGASWRIKEEDLTEVLKVKNGKS